MLAWNLVHECVLLALSVLYLIHIFLQHFHCIQRVFGCIITFSTCILIFLKFLFFPPTNHSARLLNKTWPIITPTHTNLQEGWRKWLVLEEQPMRFQYERLTRKNQDSLGSFCPLSVERKDVKLLNHTCKKAYKRLQTQNVSVSQSNFNSHCGGRTLRTWTSEDESYSVLFSEYQYGTQITQTFIVI